MFEAIDSDDLIKNPIVVVTGFSSVNKVLEFSPGIKDIVQIGDQLISYNGKSFKQMYREFKSISNGANDYGGMRSVLNLMAFRSAMLTPLQEETEVVYIFKRNSSSPEFKVIVPIGFLFLT